MQEPEGVGVNLSELIDTHRGGRSYVELSRDCGGTPSDKRLQQIVRTPIRNFPDPPTIAALAKGLRVPASAVVLAAAESLGLDVGSSMPRLVQLLPAGARHLSEQQAAAIAHLVQTIVDALPSDHATTPAAEPTVAGVQAAQQAHLRAVAQSGDQTDEALIDELARRARLDQTGKEE